MFNIRTLQGILVKENLESGVRQREPLGKEVRGEEGGVLLGLSADLDHLGPVQAGVGTAPHQELFMTPLLHDLTFMQN